jgi:hypothetical protein
MYETRIMITLLRMYIPRNWKFGSALSKRRNFGGGGVEPPTPPPNATAPRPGPVQREHEQGSSKRDKDTGRATYKSRFDSRHGKPLNLFSKATRPALGPKTVSY